MSIKDLIGRFSVLQTSVGDKIWQRTNEQNRKASKLTGAESRAMRNAQSRIRKDIKAAEKALSRGENVGRYIDTLRDIQKHMRQSNKVDGIKVYNNASERRDAMREYLTRFAGAGKRELYKTAVVDYVPRDNPLYQHMVPQYFDRLKELRDELKVYYPSVDDMESELYEMVRKYDYNKAVEIFNRLVGTINNIKSQRGSTNYDEY